MPLGGGVSQVHLEENVRVTLVDANGNPITALNPLPTSGGGGGGGGSPTVYITDPNTPTSQAKVTNSNPSVSDFGVVSRIAGSLPLPTGAATELTLSGVVTSLGADGASPPTVPGSGVRGWLRSIYDTLLSMAGLGSASAANSTNANLAGGGVFLGSSWIDTFDAPMVTVAVFSSHDSATNGLVIQYSSDGATVHDSDVYTIPANNGQSIKVGPGWRYVRVQYTNGATPTTTFVIQTLLRKVTQQSSTHRVADPINGQQDTPLVSAIMKGAGTYVPVAGSGNGSVVVPDGAWIVGIAATSPTTGNATITGIPNQIGTITLIGSIAKTSAKNLNPPLGTCIANGTTILFTGTDSYEVEYLVL